MTKQEVKPSAQSTLNKLLLGVREGSMSSIWNLAGCIPIQDATCASIHILRSMTQVLVPSDIGLERSQDKTSRAGCVVRPIRGLTSPQLLDRRNIPLNRVELQ